MPGGTVGRVEREFRRWHLEDQPATAGVDVWLSEDLSEEPAVASASRLYTMTWLPVIICRPYAPEMTRWGAAHSSGVPIAAASVGMSSLCALMNTAVATSAAANRTAPQKKATW